MMKKKEDLIQDVNTLTESMDKLTMDNVAETPVSEPEIQTKLSNKELAEQMKLRYIEPKRKLAAFGKLPDKLRKEHQHDWEYVKGIYENIEDIGSSIQFWYSKYPGDPDCLWDIPANVPVFVPRMIAKHLESAQTYHKFEYKEVPRANMNPGEFTHEFQPSLTIHRGKFRPIEAFA